MFEMEKMILVVKKFNKMTNENSYFFTFFKYCSYALTYCIYKYEMKLIIFGYHYTIINKLIKMNFRINIHFLVTMACVNIK